MVRNNKTDELRDSYKSILVQWFDRLKAKHQLKNFLGGSKLVQLLPDSEGSAEGSAEGSGSYVEHSHAWPHHDDSLNIGCGFNFQNKFWIAGGWDNSRQVLFQIEHYVMKILKMTF